MSSGASRDEIKTISKVLASKGDIIHLFSWGREKKMSTDFEHLSKEMTVEPTLHGATMEVTSVNTLYIFMGVILSTACRQVLLSFYR